MKCRAEAYTAERLYEELRPRLSLSDAWLAQRHPQLLRCADAMVAALQKKESYGGGVAQRAAHLASHLRATDPILSDWMERHANARSGGGGGPMGSVKGAAAKLANQAAEAAAEEAAAEAAAAGGSAAAAAAEDAAASGRDAAAAAAGGDGNAADVRGEGGGDAGADGDNSKAAVKKRAQGGAATALEYLTTTFGHLREQRTLVMGDRKDRLLREVAGLRQLRGGSINVLRGATMGGTSMADMLTALKRADAESEGEGEEAARGGEGGKGAAAAGRVGGRLDNLTCVVVEDWRAPERLDTLLAAGDTLCVYVEVHCRDGPEDTRLAMRLSTFVAMALCSQRLIAELYQDMFITPQRTAASRPQRKRQRTAAEETVQSLDESPHSLDFVDFVEGLHRRMPLRCGWMYANAIMPTAGEWDAVFGRQAGRLSGLYEGGPALDALGRAVMAFHHDRHESPILDVHELATHLRQQAAAAAAATAAAPPPAATAGATPVAAAAAEAAAALGSAASSVVETTAAAAAAAAASCEPARPHASPSSCCDCGCGGSGGGVNAAAARVVATATTATSTACDPQLPAAHFATTAGAAAGAADARAAAPFTAHGANGAAAAAEPFAVPSGLILSQPRDSSGRGCGLDLGHLSCCCVAAAPLSDDFLGELLRQTTVGQAAAEVAAAASAAAAVKASKCCLPGPGGGGGLVCTGACEVAAAAAMDAAAAAAAEEAAALAAAEEAELCDALQEELAAVAEAAEEAEREGEAVAGAAGPSSCGPAPASSAAAAAAAGLYLRGAFSHRLQLLPGCFFNYYIGSQAFTNTAWHVEDFLLQSINLLCVGRPKAWWWVPRDREAAFKEYLEDQWEKEDVYTKSVPLASVSVDKLIKLGVKRSVQLPGAIFITSPGYAFHTTMSTGWSMADSANFMANIIGKDMHVLEEERPLEQYPAAEGRTSTGEWVRFNMRRIEQLRARNDPAYTPRQLTRYRTEAAARRAAAAAAATEAAAQAVKKEEPEEGGAPGPVVAAAAAASRGAVKREGGAGGGGVSGSRSTRAASGRRERERGRGGEDRGEKEPGRPAKQAKTAAAASSRAGKAAAPPPPPRLPKAASAPQPCAASRREEPAGGAGAEVRGQTADAAAPSRSDSGEVPQALGRTRQRKRRFDEDFVFELPKPSHGASRNRDAAKLRKAAQAAPEAEPAAPAEPAPPAQPAAEQHPELPAGAGAGAATLGAEDLEDHHRPHHHSHRHRQQHQQHQGDQHNPHGQGRQQSASQPPGRAQVAAVGECVLRAALLTATGALRPQQPPQQPQQPAREPGQGRGGAEAAGPGEAPVAGALGAPVALELQWLLRSLSPEQQQQLLQLQLMALQQQAQKQQPQQAQLSAPQPPPPPQQQQQARAHEQQADGQRGAAAAAAAAAVVGEAVAVAVAGGAVEGNGGGGGTAAGAAVAAEVAVPQA